jgi:mono/diheme cytochrome c family protein
MIGTKWFFIACIFLTLVGAGSIVATHVTSYSVPLSDEVRAGYQVWVAQGCEGCHTLYGQGGAFAPDLTHSLSQRGETYLYEFIANPSAYHPNERLMPRFTLKQTELRALVAYLSFAQAHDLAKGVPLVVVRGGARTIASPNDDARPESDPFARARALFGQRCASCHSLEENVVIVGPSLWDIGDTAARRVVGQTAREYVRNSIVNPSDYVVEGYQDVMAKNLGEMSADDLEALIDYLLTIGARS